VNGRREPFDASALLDRVGGDQQLAIGRARAFRKGSAWMLGNLRQALVRQDPRALANAARSMRGALADIAADEAARLAEQLEALGRRNDMSKAPAAMRSLEREIERIMAALATFARAA
jgi:HPt (histidine-containing phosphotransfer) domain-containing protein